VASNSNDQGTHHFVITVQAPVGGGMACGTWSGTLTPDPGWTRFDAYEEIVARHNTTSSTSTSPRINSDGCPPAQT
jgi:hypothetical protein